MARHRVQGAAGDGQGPVSDARGAAGDASGGGFAEDNLARLVGVAADDVARARPPADPELPRRLVAAATAAAATPEAEAAAQAGAAPAGSFPEPLLALLLGELAAAVLVGLMAPPVLRGAAEHIPTVAALAALAANLAAAPLAAGLIVWRRRMARV